MIEVEFGKAQQELVDKFKERLKDAADDVISKLYVDLSAHATTDAHINYYNYLRDELRDSIVKEIVTEDSHYSWAASIRIKLVEDHKEELQNKIIEDLQAKIQRLQTELKQVYERRY